jgi:hypothetical protein
VTDQPRTSEAGASQNWILRSRDLLQHSADDLDGNTRSRLNRARQSALDALDADPVPAPRNSLRWLGGAAIAAGLALVLWQLLPADLMRRAAPANDIALSAPAVAPARPAIAPGPRVEAAPVSAPDFELLADPSQFALVEDLEFYAWLETAEGSDG